MTAKTWSNLVKLETAVLVDAKYPNSIWHHFIEVT
jgi:hypothetical protein